MAVCNEQACKAGFSGFWRGGGKQLVYRYVWPYRADASGQDGRQDKVAKAPCVGRLAALALGLLLSACASREPIRLDGQQAMADGRPGVLWTFATHKKKFFERWNYAMVTEVDGVSPPRPVSLPPVELAPGRHMVQIRYERDSYWCGYLGCLSFEQATRRLELLVEPDHSYLPLAGKYCDQDWIWIVDTGHSAQKDLDVWRERGIRPFMPFDPRSPLRDLAGLKVVAGEAPPGNCEAARE